MKRPRHCQRRQRGFSLIELIVAMTLLSVVMTATATVLRSARISWEAHESDMKRIRSAHALVRQIVRQVRDADEVLEITVGRSANTVLRIRMSDGDELEWRHDAVQKSVSFQQRSVSSQASVVAEYIDGLLLEPLRVDGETHSAVEKDRVQGVTVSVEVTLPRASGSTRRAVASSWIRAFGRSRSE
jgi:prepilin-type N-terminal cleavage/methylation domain-containing protein